MSNKTSLKKDHRPATQPTKHENESRIGFHLKRERRLKGMRLVDVADAAGISPSLISKIEHNRLNPSLSTLHRIAKALGTSVSALFAMEEQVSQVVLRPEERVVAGADSGSFPHWEGIEAEIIIPYESGRRLEGFLFVMEPGGHSGGPVQHDGEECGYVIEGQLELEVGDQIYRLGPGDSFFFQSHVVHRYRNPGKASARVIWINTPPTF